MPFHLICHNEALQKVISFNCINLSPKRKPEATVARKKKQLTTENK